MGTDPTKRLFFRRLAVEAGKDYGADEIATSVPRRCSKVQSEKGRIGRALLWGLPIDIRKSRMLQYSQIANGGSNDKKPRHTGSGNPDGEQE